MENEAIAAHRIALLSDLYAIAHRLNDIADLDGAPCRAVFDAAVAAGRTILGKDADAVEWRVMDSGEFSPADIRRHLDEVVGIRLDEEFDAWVDAWRDAAICELRACAVVNAGMS